VAVFLRTTFTDRYFIDLGQAYGLQFVWLIFSVREVIIPLNMPFYCTAFLIFETVLALVLLALPGFHHFFAIHPSIPHIQTILMSQDDLMQRGWMVMENATLRNIVKETAREVLSTVRINSLGCCLTVVEFSY
jgi:hypothetical protein